MKERGDSIRALEKTNAGTLAEEGAEGEAQEVELGREMAAALQEAEIAAQDAVEGLGPSASESEIKTVKEIIKKCADLARSVGRASMLLSCLFFARHGAEDKIQLRDYPKDGRAAPSEYYHPDKETDHIIKYLTGVEFLSDEEWLSLVKISLARMMQEVGIEVDDEFYKTPKDGLLKYLENKFANAGDKEVDLLKSLIGAKEFDPKIAALYFMNEAAHSLPRGYQHNPAVARALWRVMREAGSVKIRWSDLRVSHYFPPTNTMYVTPAPKVGFGYHKKTHYDLIFDELGHGQQFLKKPLPSYYEAAAGLLRTIGRLALEQKNIYQAMRPEYETPGAFEHEAHEIIKPDLEKKFKKYTLEEINKPELN